MTVRDPLRAIETAYADEPDEGAWLRRLVEAFEPYDQGGGVVVCTIALGDRTRVQTMAATPGIEAATRSIRSFVAKLPSPLARRVFAPTEFVGNAAWRLHRVGAFAEDDAADGDESHAKRLPPMWALVAGDGATHAMMVAFLAGDSAAFSRTDRFPDRDRRVLGLVGAHLGSTLRLRRAARTTNDAVLAPDGRVLDASGEGATKAARRSLSEAVLRAERARGTLRRTDDAEAAATWRALVAGKWSIVEVVESDGKRLLLAKANAPAFERRGALTKEENDVVWLSALGHSHKHVAYELGLSIGTVVRRLSSAMLKLGVTSRAELARKLGR
ncbi:MAG TPA: LuxR C-terminal-related transcriptional regulator [Polyangiaceae bacterium]